MIGALSIDVTVGAFMDDILYSLLGTGEARQRATLRDMLDPERSPFLLGPQFRPPNECKWSSGP